MIQLKAWDKDFTVIDFTRKPGLYNSNDRVFTVTNLGNRLLAL